MRTKRILQRRNSSQKYIDSLQNRYSKILVVRVDLAYKKPYSDNITLEESTKDLMRLLNNRRNNQTIFEHNIGYIVKKEYSESKGIHFHAFFFFNGQYLKKDSFKASQIGKYWCDKITQGEGSYYNCNFNKYPEHGIGMLHYDDTQKREYLDKAMDYLSKDEQHIEVTDKKYRSIVRGTMPRIRRRIGRPRREDKTFISI